MPTAIIESECTIDAPINQVWKVLVNLENYGEWNPFVQEINANLQQIGSPVILHVDMNLKKRNNHKKVLVTKQELMTCNAEVHLLQWRGGVLGGSLLRNLRTQRLTAAGGNGGEQTKYYTSDEFWGPLVHVVTWLHGENIQVGFDANAAALKERCEEKCRK
jgi:hypothetical protein